MRLFDGRFGTIFHCGRLPVAMQSALVIGGTRFIGRHTVTELLDHEYDVAIFNRGNHENPFEDDDRVTHVPGDRTDRAVL